MKVFITHCKRRGITFLLPLGMNGSQFKNFKILYRDEIREARNVIKSGQVIEIKEDPDIVEKINRIFNEEEDKLEKAS
jgi:hypothetical protein